MTGPLSSHLRHITKPARIVYAADNRLQQMFDMCFKYDNWTINKYGSSFLFPKELWFPTIKEVQEYVDRSMNNPDVFAMWPDKFARIKVKHSPYVDRGDYSRGVIRLPENDAFLRETAVIHEMAHHFGGNGHSTQFITAYRRLLDVLMAPEVSAVYMILIYEATEQENQNG